MTKDENKKENTKDFVKQNTDYMNAFRHNVLQLMDERDITLNQLAESSNLSIDTLKSFLYKESKDCKLVTAVALAKALDISLDRLVSAGTLHPTVMECLEIAGRLPQNEYDFLIWYIRHLDDLYRDKPLSLPSLINVITPKCANGTLLWSNEWTHQSMEGCDSDTRVKCFMGLRVPCSHYMPAYSNGDILLIAHDRRPVNGEHCVIEMNNYLYIVRCVRVGSEFHFHSIIHADTSACITDITRVVGYVAHVMKK